MAHSALLDHGCESDLPFAGFEDPEDRLNRELAYLRSAVEELAPGTRILDLGHGTGLRAVGLASAGFTVTGFVHSRRVVSEARRRAAPWDDAVRWEVLDPRAVRTWPIAECDAICCGRAFGLGSDADRRRILGQARRHLVRQGVLILSLPNALGEARQFTHQSTLEVDGEPCSIRRTYDPLDGRIRGTLTMMRAGRPERVVPFESRCYVPSELGGMVRAAGFELIRVDGDFVPGNPVGEATRDLQLIARPLPAPPSSLAVVHWRTPARPGLELRYAPDETEWLDQTPGEIWNELIRTEADHGAAAAEYYPVDDPYGAERGAPAVSAYFGCGCAIGPDRLTFGPGVTSLLAALAGLAEGGRILAQEPVHPDLESWAVAMGADVHLLPRPLDARGLEAAIAALRPALVHMDRPTFAGELLAEGELVRVAERAALVGAVVLIDESPASYLGPAGSCVPLTTRAGNLVVLRGMTKAFSCGGMRVGFAVAGEAIAPRVRELVSPLQVGELSFRAALKVLAAGDLFGPLRARIREMKPVLITALERLGMTVLPGHRDLPWVLIPDEDGAAERRLAELGIRGLRLAPQPVCARRQPDPFQLFVPLSEARMAAFLGLVDNFGMSPAYRGQ